MLTGIISFVIGGMIGIIAMGIVQCNRYNQYQNELETELETLKKSYTKGEQQ